jgi:hypothetical protein
MKGGAGCPMRIVTAAPRLGKPDGLKSADLSAEAKLRLKVSGCCRRPGRFSGMGLPNVPPFRHQQAGVLLPEEEVRQGQSSAA